MDVVFCIPSPSLMIGALVGMSALAQQSRVAPQRRQSSPIFATLFYGVVSFALSFVLSSRLAVSAYPAVFGNLLNPDEAPSSPVLSEAALDQADVIIDELWFRAMVPPPLRQSCYHAQDTVCDLADEAVPAVQGGDWGWSSYARLLGKGTISAVLTISLVWFGASRRIYEPDGEEPGEETSDGPQGGGDE
jgi:hypothetical protein